MKFKVGDRIRIKKKYVDPKNIPEMYLQLLEEIHIEKEWLSMVYHKTFLVKDNQSHRDIPEAKKSFTGLLELEQEDGYGVGVHLTSGVVIPPAATVWYDLPPIFFEKVREDMAPMRIPQVKQKK